MDLWSYIREGMLKHPSQTICESETALTYEEMIIAAESLSESLNGQTCCAIYCKSELLTALALLGCFASGTTAVPLSFRYGHNHCNKILQSVSPSCVITDIEGEFGIYDILDSEYISPKKETAIIMHTSGTSGIPKGAMLGGQSIITNVKDILSYFRIDRSDVILISRPLYHCAVLTGELITALIQGAKIIFSSEPFNPLNLLTTIKEKHVTIFGGTPTLLEALSHFIREPDNISIKKITVSGECLSNSTAKKIRSSFPNSEIHHVYGLTEACPRISHLPTNAFDSHPTCVGYPLNSVKIKIIDNNGNSVANEKVGTLWVHGKNIMHGYYNNPKATKAVLKNGWLCTGDSARITKEGFLQILGRTDEMIIRAGMNIYPQEIEEEIKKDPRTREVLVQGGKTGSGGTQIIMKIAGDFKEINEVSALCKHVLPSYQIPSKIEIVESLQKNGTGKIVRRNKND